MASLDFTSFDFALKEMYPKEEIENQVFTDRPWLAMIDKDPDASGDVFVLPTIYGNPQGRSASIATAITNKSATSGVKFNLTPVSDYAVASIDHKTMMASRKDEGAMADAVEQEMDGAINNCANSLAKALYRDGHGHLGQIASVTVANPMVITLLDINDAVNFEAKMVLEADDTEAGTSLRATPATITIVGLNEDAGTITTAYDNSGTTTTWAPNDYLFQDGDESAMISGLAAWIPTTAPAATAFFGVDRTANVTRLGGGRVVGTGMPVSQALLRAAAKCGRNGGKPDVILLNDVQYYELIVDLGSKVEFVEQGVTAEVYFSGVVIHGPKGKLEVYPDRFCPSGVGYVLTKDSWTLFSYEEAPHIFDRGNDQKLLREATADAYEVRVGYFAQNGTDAPGSNCVVTFDAATFA